MNYSEWLRELGYKYLSKAARRRLVRYTRWPPVGLVRFGSLRRLRPISPNWGMERGQPIDRYYIEKFLAAQASDIRGRVLEIGGNAYTRRFGGNQVTESVVLHVAEQKEVVTLIGDLTTGENIAADSFDCVILTQTLCVIFDMAAALRTVYRILQPGGVALITVPGISKISRYDAERWGHYWSFTTASMGRLVTAVFPPEGVQIAAYGNVLVAIAFLQGLASQELKRRELGHIDPDYEVLITVRATKPEKGR
jgi:SAM-dependent methyltransferase